IFIFLLLVQSFITFPNRSFITFLRFLSINTYIVMMLPIILTTTAKKLIALLNVFMLPSFRYLEVVSSAHSHAGSLIELIDQPLSRANTAMKCVALVFPLLGRPGKNNFMAIQCTS